MTEIPVAIDVDVPLRADGKPADIRTRVAARATWQAERTYRARQFIEFSDDAIDYLEATAGGGGRTNYPVSRAFTGAKKRRVKLPANHVHSRDRFRGDARDTRRGPFLAIKNDAPYANALLHGAYYQTGPFAKKHYRRPELIGVIRALGRFLKGPASAAQKQRIIKAMERAKTRDLLEAHRRSGGTGR